MISLPIHSVGFDIGQTIHLSATGPGACLPLQFRVRPSDSSVVHVSPDGAVTGIAFGTAYVHLLTGDGTPRDSIKFLVAHTTALDAIPTGF